MNFGGTVQNIFFTITPNKCNRKSWKLYVELTKEDFESCGEEGRLVWTSGPKERHVVSFPVVLDILVLELKKLLI